MPTDDGGLGSQDQPPTPQWSASQSLDDAWNWIKSHDVDIAAFRLAVASKDQVFERAISVFVKVIGYLAPELAELEAELIEAWVSAEATAYQKAADPLEQAAATEASVALDLLTKVMTGSPDGNTDFGAAPLSSVIESFFTQILQPFTLVNSGLDPTVVGSGLKAQQWLLSKSLALTMQEWIVEQLGQHLGMGFFKTLAPFLGILDRSINPSNVVRQAVESSYTVLLKAPLTRDLNHQYPIKDLGVSALAKLFIRGAIDQQTYLNRCLDTGLNNEQAQQLILETAKQLSRSDIARLLTAGYLTQQDARNLLQQQGWQDTALDAVLYLDTHARYFTIQERIATKAVTAWQHKYIDTAQLESILQQMGFTQDEITLLEIEGQFTKNTDGQRKLTYTQVKSMFEANILGIDDVLTFLQNDGYSETDTTNLVLLDFVQAAERTEMKNKLVAQFRVQQQEALVAAQSELTKNETALAAAKQALAAELQKEADLFGQLTNAPAILPVER